MPIPQHDYATPAIYAAAHAARYRISIHGWATPARFALRVRVISVIRPSDPTPLGRLRFTYGPGDAITILPSALADSP